eukprot:3471264-Rhodomonas_salina.1
MARNRGERARERAGQRGRGFLPCLGPRSCPHAIIIIMSVLPQNFRAVAGLLSSTAHVTLHCDVPNPPPPSPQALCSISPPASSLLFPSRSLLSSFLLSGSSPSFQVPSPSPVRREAEA